MDSLTAGFLSGFSWDFLVVCLLVAGAVWFVARRVAGLGRPACGGGCPGCRAGHEFHGCQGGQNCHGRQGCSQSTDKSGLAI